MNTNEVTARVAQYWRYDKQCPLVAFEATNGGELADVLVVNKTGQIIETEVKVSLSDLNADLKKVKHLLFYRSFFGEEPPDWKVAKVGGWKEHIRREGFYLHYNKPKINKTSDFYFAVPAELVVKAKVIIEKKYPWAGLLVVQDKPMFYGGYVTVAKKPKRFTVPKVGMVKLARLSRDMSATLVRLAMKDVGLET